MRKYIGFILVVTVFISCQKIKPQDNLQTTTTDQRFQPQDYVTLTHPEWSKNAAIYQLNTRQFMDYCFVGGEKFAVGSRLLFYFFNLTGFCLVSKTSTISILFFLSSTK